MRHTLYFIRALFSFLLLIHVYHIDAQVNNITGLPAIIRSIELTVLDSSSAPLPVNDDNISLSYIADTIVYNVEFTFNVGLLNSQNISIDAALVLPSSVFSVNSNCNTRINGSTVGCNTNSMVSYYVTLLLGNATVSVESPLQRLPPGALQGARAEQQLVLSGGELRYLETLAVNQTLLNASDSDDVARVNLQVPFQLLRVHGLRDYSTQLRTFIGGVPSTANPPPAVTVRRRGPELQVQGVVQGVAGGVEAGDTIQYTFTIEHEDDVSTENALGATLVLSFSADQAQLVSGSLRYQPSTGANFTVLPDNSVSSISIGTMTLNQTVTVQLSRLATDQLLIPSTLVTTATASYTRLASPSMQIFEDVGTANVATKSIVFGSSSGDDQDLPLVMGVNSPFSIRRTVQIPLGTIQNYHYFAEFSSSTLQTIPVQFLQSTVTVPTHVTWNTSLANIDSSQFTISSTGLGLSGRRRKRQSQSTLSVLRPIGQLVNPSSGGTSETSITLQISVYVGSSSGGSVIVDTGVSMSGQRFYIQFNSNSLINFPVLIVTKTVENINYTALPSTVRFNVTVQHSGSGNVGSSAVTTVLTDGTSALELDTTNPNNMLPPNSEGSINTGRTPLITWNRPNLASTSSLFISYIVTPRSLPNIINTFEASVTWKSSTTSNITYGPLRASVCINRVDVFVTNFFTNHGFTVLAAIAGLVLGILIIIIVTVILMRCDCKVPNVVRPRFDLTRIKETGRGLITDTHAAMKKGFNTIKDLSSTAVNESIIFILSMKDKLKLNRELDNLDIVATIEVDTAIERERNAAMVNSATQLVESLRVNGDLSKSTTDKATQAFKRNCKNLENDLDSNYDRDVKKIYKKLGSKNKDKLAKLFEKQENDRQDLEDQIRGLPLEKREEMKDLLAQQQETETNDLTYLLKLEQDEETEKLRKDYSIRKRMGIKDLQQEYLDRIKKDGNLSEEQISWLMKEHAQNQGALERIYDNEISRQRMVLEEKLARRRALANASEEQEASNSELLNTMAGHQLKLVNKMKKDQILAADEAKEIIDGVKQRMRETKERQEQQRLQQEIQLQQKLSQRKRQALQEKAKTHQQELTDFDKNSQAQLNEGYTLPLQTLESRQLLLSNQRSEMSAVENEIDEEHAQELEKLHDNILSQTMKEIEESKTNLLVTLKRKGLKDDSVERILNKHKTEIEGLQIRQLEDKKMQKDNFKKKLAENRRAWAQKREEEKQEQDALREHEDNVVRKLLDSQVAMSEEERDKIMKEHEKHMVKLENSLTFNKLQQKRILEERLAKRKAQQLEKLERKQNNEIKKQKKAFERDGSDIDDDERHEAELELLREHAQNRLSVLQGGKLQLDDEMENIRVEIMQNRADALKDQEVRLGAMVAQLQMDKAKERARIEEQQKAIEHLKSNLMDELNSKGILSDPETQRVIQIHQKEKEKLNERLESQKLKQEKALRRRMNERLASKEQQLASSQETQMRDSLNGLNLNSTAAKLRRAALKQRQLIEMEKFRNDMEKEISQTHEEMKRKFELKQLKAAQDQEIQFLNGLVRLGKFDPDELESVVALLLPNKTKDELKEILNGLCEGYVPPSTDLRSDARESDFGTSSLRERVKSARSAHRNSAFNLPRPDSRQSRSDVRQSRPNTGRNKNGTS